MKIWEQKMNLEKYLALVTHDYQVWVYDENGKMVGYLNEYFNTKRSAVSYAKQFGKVEFE